MTFELIAGMVGALSERFGPALVTASTAAGIASSGPLACGAVVMLESVNCRSRNSKGDGDGVVVFDESTGPLSAAIVGGATSVAVGGETLAGWRAVAAGAMAGSTIGVSFGLAGEMVTNGEAACSAKLGLAALGGAAGSLAIGRGGEMLGASAVSGADCDGPMSAAAGASHATEGQSQQHRRFRSLQAAAGSTSSKHTEVQTNP